MSITINLINLFARYSQFYDRLVFLVLIINFCLNILMAFLSEIFPFNILKSVLWFSCISYLCMQLFFQYLIFMINSLVFLSISNFSFQHFHLCHPQKYDLSKNWLQNKTLYVYIKLNGSLNNSKYCSCKPYILICIIEKPTNLFCLKKTTLQLWYLIINKVVQCFILGFYPIFCTFVGLF